MAFPALIQKILDLQQAIRDLRSFKEAAWTISADVANGGILQLPSGISYLPGKSLVELFWDGLSCNPGEQFEETAAASGQDESTTLKLLFKAPAQSEFRVLIRPRLSGESLGPVNLTEQFNSRLSLVESMVADMSEDVAYHRR